MKETVAEPKPRTAATAVGAPGTVSGTTADERVDQAPVPMTFVARTRQVYVLPFVRPVTVIGLVAPLTDPATPPSEDVQFAVYEPMVAPPAESGARNATRADWFPRSAEAPRGAPGTVANTKPPEAAETGPAPMAFTARAVQVYVLPAVSAVTVIGLAAPFAEPVAPLSEDVQVTVYEVIAAAPLPAGAENVTATDPFPRVATPIVGEPGTVAAVKDVEATDAVPAPIALVAATVQA